MKERFNVEIVGINFSIVSDDGEELVRKAEATLNEDVRTVLKQMGRFSKLDAVTLCALDYCGQAQKAEAKIKNLEAQIEILEANMHRMREDSPAKTAEPKAVAEPVAEAKAEAAAETKAEAKAEPAVESTTDAEPAAETKDSSRSQKLRQLEAFLGSQLKIDLDK